MFQWGGRIWTQLNRDPPNFLHTQHEEDLRLEEYFPYCQLYFFAEFHGIIIEPMCAQCCEVFLFWWRVDKNGSLLKPSSRSQVYKQFFFFLFLLFVQYLELDCFELIVEGDFSSV